MLELRFHGRGGQGAVTSAELLAQAAIVEGKYAQAFPSFGPERRGAPVVAFCRIDDHPICLRTNVNNPDVVIVLDPSLLNIVNVTAGMKRDGTLIVNTKYPPNHLKKNGVGKVATVHATRIALDTLRVPITNTTLLGALVKATGVITLESLAASVERRFGKRNGEMNIEALRRAYEETVVLDGHCS